MKKIVLFITITLLTITQLQAQGWGQTQKIVPDDRFIGQQFGGDVAIDGNYAVVGVLVNNSARDAYVYENDVNGNWIQIQKLQSPNFNQFDHFGTAVAISGDYIFVGAWGQSYDEANSNYLQSAGAVYIFKKQASGLFDFEQKIVASDREALNAFGYGIALSGDYAVVSPVRHDFDVQPGTNFLDDAGAAYIFERDGTGTWNEVQKIVASDRGVQDYFGQEGLAVSGNTIVVGAKFEDEDTSGINTLNAAGSAYIFQRDGIGEWNEVQKIVASNRQGSELFGSDVSVNGDYLLVGAEQGNVAAGYTGSAYIFERDGTGNWSELQEIVASQVASIDRFGKSVSFDGNHILVGAYLKEIGSAGDGGAAFMFEKDGTGFWNETAVMYDPDASSSDYFGFSVAVSGDYAIVGAYQEDEDETEMNTINQAGSAYIFNINEPNTLDPLNTLSLVENNFEKAIKAYPNPVINNLNIDFERFYDNVAITITNVLGRKLFFHSYQNIKSLELPFNTSKGLYLVEVKIDSKTTSVLKIVKQ